MTINIAAAMATIRLMILDLLLLPTITRRGAGQTEWDLTPRAGRHLLADDCPHQVFARSISPGINVGGSSRNEKALGGTARVATFDTRFQMPRLLTGSAAASASKVLKHAGAHIVAPPESFFVSREDPPTLIPGEIDRAKTWVRTVVG